MKTIIYSISILFFISGCVTYSEKNSEALSRAVYATKDSLEKYRIDLADSYSKEAARIAIPPKERIQIKPIIKQSKPVTLLPKGHSGNEVISVGSPEYIELIKNSLLYKQLENDKRNAEMMTLEVDIQLAKEAKITNDMILKIQDQQLKLTQKDAVIAKKNLTIIKLSIVLSIILIAIGIYLYFKLKTYPISRFLP